jgi:lysophospholipase L1-like esterase
LNAGQTITPEILGDYSARYLFDAHDLLAVAHDAGLDTTQTSNLFFAHWSAFYASRATIRNYLINVVDPPYASALHELARTPQPLPPESQMIVIARARLRAINELCRRKGSDFIFLVPPSLSNLDEALIKAAALENVKVTVPLPAGTVGAEYFRADGFHLNEKGATLFTKKLAQELRLGMNSRH